MLTSLAHAALALAAVIAVWRALQQAWVTELAPDEPVLLALRVSFPLMAAAGSALAIAAGRLGGRELLFVALDAASLFGLLLGVFLLSLGPFSREVAGVVLVLVLAIRLAPAAWWIASRAAPAWLVFAASFVAYAVLAIWFRASSLPLGDQVFYLLATERLGQGTVHAEIDPSAFRALLGTESTDIDRATHVADTPVGPRLVQGYAIPILLLPGHALLGPLGAYLTVALFAAWTSAQTYLLLRETVARPALAGAVWLLAAFLPPLLPLATHVYPNVFGAAALVTAYRLLLTAPVRSPGLAGALLAATFFLTPRDGLAFVALAPFALRLGPALASPFFATALAVLALAVVVNTALYALPLPYAGYVYGTAAAQAAVGLPSFTFFFWVGLPAILFDRTFGIAGSAPWLFLAALGAYAALRIDRARLLPAAAAIAVTLVALSLFRYWEGGYAPPNRYLVNVLPLAAPFVAHGLGIALARPSVRVVAIGLVALSALAGLLLAAVPTLGLNTAFDHRLQDLLDDVLGLNPLGWLPSFQPVSEDWYVAAYLRLVPAVALVAILAWLGVRRTERA